jgi:hypothetical protein
MEQLPIDPITVQVTPSLQLLSDVVTTAVEGGINYWSQMIKYKWEGLDFPEAVLLDVADPDGVEHTITPEVVRKGLQLAITPGVCHPQSNTFTSVMSALTQNDAGSIDSDAADNVIQLGLFSKIMYA